MHDNVAQNTQNKVPVIGQHWNKRSALMLASIYIDRAFPFSTFIDAKA